MNCQHCQNLLLDHLYGLLDGPEVAAVDAHLASCPACAAARAETARVQGLIARAAKSTFPNAKFEPPVPAPVSPQPAKGGTRTPTPTASPAFPAPLTRTPSGQRPARWFRVAAILPWAVAAAVLIAIPSTVVPVLDIFDRAEATRREAQTAWREAETARRAAHTATTAVETAKAERKHRLDDAQHRLTVAEQTQTALLSKWFGAQNAAVQAAFDRKLTVDVVKPAIVQPGAPNDFLVVVRDGRDRWETSGKRMIAEVHAVDASDAVIFTQPLDHERRGDMHQLRLPAAAWSKVKPNAELFLVVSQVDEKTGTRTELQERVRLAGPVFATLLVTDKATYRPGDRLFFRSLTLDRVTFRPPAREQILKYELLNPNGRPVSGLNVTGTTELLRVGTEGQVDPVRTTDGQPVRGVGCGEFVLPPDLPDGDYTLSLREQEFPGGPPATVPLPVVRLVKVRAGVAEHYRKQIAFARASYVPGDMVEAAVEVKFQGKPAPNVAIAAVAVAIDGQPVKGAEFPKATDKNGRVTVRFTLPNEVLNGDVRLKVAFQTPLGDESVTQRVPVVGNRLTVEFFPESGDAIVAGVPCKVYVRATTPAGQPVEFRGVVTDGREVLARVESLHDDRQPGANRGLASFTYTPKLGGRAWLKLESPAGAYAPILPGVPVPNTAVALMGGPGAAAVRTGFPLPETKRTGVVMSVLDPITEPGEAIRVQLYSVGQPRTLVVGAYTRGRLSDTRKVTVEPDLPKIVPLMAGADPLTGGRGGVVRITAFEELDEKQDLKPVAERLVFRKPGEVLNLALAPTFADAPAGATTPFAPGQSPGFPAGSAINLSVTATDEKGNPAAAVLWAAVVNSGVAPGAKDRLMPTHFLLAGEVKNPDDLEFADFLLTNDPKDQKLAAEALDLLLGTQGWRRFAEQMHPLAAPNQRAVSPNPEMTRLMVQNGQYAMWTEQVPVRNPRKLFETYAPLCEAAVKAADQAKATMEATRAQTSLEAARAETADVRAISQASSAAEAAHRTAAEKVVKADTARQPVERFRSGVWYGVVGLAALALCCGVISLARPSGRLPLGFSTLGAVGLAAFLMVAAGWDDARAAAPDMPTLAPAGAERQESPAVRLNERSASALPSTPMPAAPSAAMPAKPGTTEMKSDAMLAKMTDDNSGAGKGGLSFNASRLKDVPPPFLPPSRGSPNGGFGGPHSAPMMRPGGMGGGGMQPLPVPASQPSAGSALGAPPPPGAMAGGAKRIHPNEVSEADFTAGQDTIKRPFGNLDRGGNNATEADGAKKATEGAARYAHERAKVLNGAFDSYLATHEKLPALPPKVKHLVLEQLRAAVNPVPPLVVREFAAPRPGGVGGRGGDTDAPDTVLWQPVIVLPGDGKAALTFNLGSARGGYEVVIAGHTSDGRLGAIRGHIRVTPAQTPTRPTIELGAPGVPTGSIPPVVPIAPAPPRMP